MSQHHEEDDIIKSSAAEYVPFEDYQKDIIILRAQAAAASATPGIDHHGDDEDNNLTSHPTAPTNPSTTTTTTTPPPPAAAALVSSRSLPNIHDTDALTASDIAKPGGFRRQYVQATTTTTTSPNNNNNNNNNNDDDDDDDDDGILRNTPEEGNSSQTPQVEHSSNAGNDLKLPLLSLPENNTNNTGTVPNRRADKDDVMPRPMPFHDDYHHDNKGDGGSPNIDINSPAIDDEDENHEALKESIMDNLTYMFDFFTDVENNNGYDDDRGHIVACIVSGDISEDAGVSESVREGLATNYDKIVHAFYVIVLLT
ncbi:hypothetical protein FOZ63_002935, partial [Perkinsus olseni]